MAFAPKVIMSRDRNGFSLVEILIATGILGFCISVILALFANALHLNQISRNLTFANSHAQYVLEDIRSNVFANVSTMITDGTWDWDAAAIQAKGLTLLSNETITTTVSGANVLTVTVTVAWTEEGGRNRAVSVTTEMGGG